jgi:predicted metal-binding membrane protein
MEHFLLLILAIFSIWFCFTQADGPFDLILKGRNALFRNRYVGVFAYKLFSCPYCSGCWSALIAYLLQPFPIVLWFLAGGTICLLLSRFWN